MPAPRVSEPPLPPSPHHHHPPPSPPPPPHAHTHQPGAPRRRRCARAACPTAWCGRPASSSKAGRKAGPSSRRAMSPSAGAARERCRKPLNFTCVLQHTVSSTTVLRPQLPGWQARNTPLCGVCSVIPARERRAVAVGSCFAAAFCDRLRCKPTARRTPDLCPLSLFLTTVSHMIRDAVHGRCNAVDLAETLVGVLGEAAAAGKTFELFTLAGHGRLLPSGKMGSWENSKHLKPASCVELSPPSPSPCD